MRILGIIGIPEARAAACLRLLAAAGLLALGAEARAGGIPELEAIMRDPVWIGAQPREPQWSLDGSRLFFRMRDLASTDEEPVLFEADLEGGAARRVSSSEAILLPTADGAWDRARARYVFSSRGDLFLADLAAKTTLQLTRTTAVEEHPCFERDEIRIVYVCEGNIFVREIAGGAVRQITDLRPGKKPPEEGAAPAGTDENSQHEWLRKEEEELIVTLRRRREQKDVSEDREQELDAQRIPAPIFLGEEGEITDLTLAPDGRYVTLTLRSGTDGDPTLIPHYIDESAYVRTEDARPKVGDRAKKHRFGVVELATEKVRWLEPDQVPGAQKDIDLRVHAPQFNRAGERAFVQVYAANHKDRWLLAIDLAELRLTPIDHQHDDAWVGWTPGIGRYRHAGEAGWMPDDERVWFLSERSGWVHLFAARPGEEAQALTSGEFEVYSPLLGPAGNCWYLHTNRTHPGERHFYRMALDGGEMTALTGGPHWYEATLAPTELRMAVLRSEPHRPPELYLSDLGATPGTRRLFPSISEEFRSCEWIVPDFVQFPARDGTMLHARLFLPVTGSEEHHSAVIFVHGAGYLQEVTKGWSGYFREYMCHNLLASRGFTVLDIDYRGSKGYGRAFRTAIYQDMGGRDLSDQVDGALWLIANHGISQDRVGIYGGSYGGFLTLLALFRHGEVFAAGAALRPVTDWAHYNSDYAAPILGGSPVQFPDVYRRCSPIYYADGLRGSLLIAHGMIDDNVQFQDSVRLVQRLIELKKEDWELAVYPLERHAFREPESWLDEYRRTLKLFEEMRSRRSF